MVHWGWRLWTKEFPKLGERTGGGGKDAKDALGKRLLTAEGPKVRPWMS